MDAGYQGKRKFPGYSLAQLEAMVTAGPKSWQDEDTLERIAAEVAARKAGTSVPFRIL